MDDIRRLFFFVTIIIYPLVTVAQFSACNTNQISFGISRGGQLKGHVIDIIQDTRSLVDCLSFCARNPVCKSVNFARETGTCELSEQTILTSNPEDFDSNEVNLYFGILPVWTEWEAWSSCSTSCGPGIQIRIRLCCDAGAPGEPCNGPSSESKNCTLAVCACEDVLAPTDGSVSPTNSDFTPGTTLSFSCNSGYLLLGAEDITCQVDYSWTASAPSCEYIPPTFNPGPLGMEDGSIANSQIKASSYYGGHDFRPWKGRLRNGDYWATSNSFPPGSWIQVDLLTSVIMTGIRTQGSGTSWLQYTQYVKTLKIQTGNSESSLSYIMDGNAAKVFTANSDRNTIKDITFPDVVARYLRIRPQSIHSWCSLRFEVIGCVDLASCS